jgi:hypothetical protein
VDAVTVYAYVFPVESRFSMAPQLASQLLGSDRTANLKAAVVPGVCRYTEEVKNSQSSSRTSRTWHQDGATSHR